jgi:hypothetical protein
MAGLGRFKLTDALPDQPAQTDAPAPDGAGPPSSPVGKRNGRGGSRRKVAKAKDKSSLTGGLAAEQVREARESKQAKNAESSTRERMVEIGRGNQQAGRQRAK